MIKTGIVLSLILGLTVNIGCGGKSVQKNDKIKVEYTGTFDDGTVFDKSQEGQPLEFTVGKGEMIPGFDKAVEGMKLNEEKKFTLKPEEAYGNRDETKVQEFPRNTFPPNINPVEGMTVALQDQNGRQIPARIISVTDKSVIIDLNNPMAGKNLTFTIKVVDIQRAQ